MEGILAQLGILGKFDSGKEQVFFKGERLTVPLICFEEQFSDLFCKALDSAPDYFISLSNESWIPDADFLEWRVLQARARAIESGTPLLRITHQGHSLAIDPLGRIFEAQGEANSVTTISFPLYQIPTIYALIGSFWLFYVASFLTLLFLLKMILALGARTNVAKK